MDVERVAREEGFKLIAGVDEVGRGALAGPVTLGLVVLPSDFSVSVTDSKLLTKKMRQELSVAIRQAAIVSEVMHIEASFIDEYGINAAQVEAGKRLLQMISPTPDLILLDGKDNYLAKSIQENTKIITIIRGDQVSASIAAASIIAKQARDELMGDLGQIHPEYGLDSHVGYGSLRHRQAILQHGPTDIHRRSFLKSILG